MLIETIENLEPEILEENSIALEFLNYLKETIPYLFEVKEKNQLTIRDCRFLANNYDKSILLRVVEILKTKDLNFVTNYRYKSIRNLFRDFGDQIKEQENNNN